MHPSETNLQVLRGQTGVSFNLIFTRLAGISSNETLLPMPALGFIPSWRWWRMYFPTKIRMFGPLGLNWAVMLMSDTLVLKNGLMDSEMQKDWMSFQRLTVLYVVQMISPCLFPIFSPRFHVFWQTNVTRMLKGLTRIEKTFLTWWFWLLIFGLHFSEPLEGCSVPVWDVMGVT